MIGPRGAFVAFLLSLGAVALALGADPRELSDASGFQNALDVARAFGRPELGGETL